MVLILPAWLLVSFYMAQFVLFWLFRLMSTIGVPLASVNQSLLNTIWSAALYVATLALMITLPLLIKKRSNFEKDEVGLNRLPSWTDILITPAGLIIYVILSSIVMLIFSHLFSGIDLNQAQETGFSNLSRNYEYILAFITLVVVAPVAEEILFRGFLFSKLKKYVPTWLAIVVTSVLFGAIHGQWDLAIDTFALSVVLCLLREVTGSLWSSMLLHMTKNGIAFYFLFINPILLTTLVK